MNYFHLHQEELISLQRWYEKCVNAHTFPEMIEIAPIDYASDTTIYEVKQSIDILAADIKLRMNDLAYQNSQEVKVIFGC
jgi:hypothetical protein